MKKNYEATYILNIQGKEEGVDEIADFIKQTIEGLGGTVTGSQRVGNKSFERVAGKKESGYYLGTSFELDPGKISDLENKFVLDDRIYRQFYLTAKPATPADNPTS
jgi:small subunit ribosomal protein S6